MRKINPGDTEHKISSIIKVTSGNTEKVANWIDHIWFCY